MKNYVIDFTVTNHYQVTVRAPSEEAARAWFDSEAGQETSGSLGVETDSYGPQLENIEFNSHYSPDVTVDDAGKEQEEP